jgi:hypothetical protein
MPYYFPVPVTPIECGLLLALLLIVTVVLSVPAVVGAKPNVTVHLPFGATAPVQLVTSENSLDPVILPPPKVTVEPPFFGAVLVSVTTFTLLRPTFTFPKFIRG